MQTTEKPKEVYVPFGEYCLGKMADAGVESFLVQRIKKLDETFDYRADKIPIGINSQDGKIVYITFKEACVIVVFGKRGSGKTYLLLSILSRAIQHENNLAIVPCAVKNEFSVINDGVQKKFQKFLLRRETPTGANISTYRPIYLDNVLETKFKDQTLMQIGFNDLTAHDIIGILGDDFSQYRSVLEEIFLKTPKGQVTREYLLDLIKTDKTLMDRQKSKISREIDVLVNSGLVGEQKKVDFSQEFKTNKIPVMNFQGFETLNDIQRDYCSILIAHPLRELMRYKEKGIIAKDKKLLVFLDEAEMWYPKSRETSSKEVIKRYLDIGRGYRISVCFSFKDLSRVDPTIFRQAKYVFMPKVTLTEAKEIFKESIPSSYDNPYTFGRDVAEELSYMRKYRSGQRDWKMINTETQEIKTIMPLAPLCRVQEEGA